MLCVLVFTKSPKVEDHIADLEKVLKRFEKFGIQVKGNKAQTRIAIHAVFGSHHHTDRDDTNPEKTAAIEKLEYPKTLKELRSVLGMFAYYRRFIAKFSEIAAPLYEQTKKMFITLRIPRDSFNRGVQNSF